MEIKMKTPNIKTLTDLRAEILAVARGEKLASSDAARLSFESVEATLRLVLLDSEAAVAELPNQPLE